VKRLEVVSVSIGVVGVGVGVEIYLFDGGIPSSGSQTLRLAGAPLLPAPIGSCFVYSII
jgi:hypothetical protein